MAKLHPTIIQGGMGIAVSDWRLARSVSQLGQIGVVSATAINSVLVRRLQDGDPEGMMRKALEAFPCAVIARKILDQYFIPGGRSSEQSYKRSLMFAIESPLPLLQLTVAASFVEVWLAKQGHSGLVGVNLLEKIQLPNLACLYGAMLADVDYVLMGAGIPKEIPGALDLMSEHQEAKLKIPVVGAKEDVFTKFDPIRVMGGKHLRPLKRPLFFPIVSSSVLAQSLIKKANGRVDGFVVEGPLAGGHNAPPRGPLRLNEIGEPVYGDRDQVALSEMAQLGLPFYMAGSQATPENLKVVLEAGGSGIQVGTLFAFANESGLKPELRREVLKKINSGERPTNGWVFTDPHSSPTGFPFKAVRLAVTVAEENTYLKRRRICDLGYLRHAYQDEARGRIGYRCPAEPLEDWVKKSGVESDTQGKKCLCNALMADIGMAQVQSWGYEELPLLTAGDDLNLVNRIMAPGSDSYSVREVLSYLTEGFTLNSVKSRVSQDAEALL